MFASTPMFAPLAINYQTPGSNAPNLLKAAGFGSVYFVDSNGGGSTTSGGRTPESAFTTIDSAIGACTADKGDMVLVMPGHAETITAANAIDLDIAGVSVIGLGMGDLKPTITFGTSTAATIRMQAKNTLIRNLRLVNNIDSLVKFINVNKNFCTIEDCDFVTSSTKEATSFVNIATTFDYTTIRRCRFEQPSDPAGVDGDPDTGAIFLVDSEYTLIEDCWFNGNFETAIIHNRGTACENLWLRRCFGIQLLSGAEPFQLVASAGGGAIDCGFITPAETAVTEATLSGTIPVDFFMFNTRFGNDGGGGQNAVLLADAS